MTNLDDLLAAIFEDQLSPFYGEFAGWVRGSRRFRAFVTAYRGKIRTKLRQVGGGEWIERSARRAGSSGSAAEG